MCTYHHNTPYAGWHMNSAILYLQGLRVTLFVRKQTKSSGILFLIFADAFSWRHMKDQIKIYTFPVSFSLENAELNLVGNYWKLRGLRTVNPTGCRQLAQYLILYQYSNSCMPLGIDSSDLDFFLCEKSVELSAITSGRICSCVWLISTCKFVETQFMIISATNFINKKRSFLQSLI